MPGRDVSRCVLSLVVSDDKLFVGCNDGTVHVCTTSDYSAITTLILPTKEKDQVDPAVWSLAMYKCRLFVGRDNGTIAVFNTDASPMTRMRSLGVHDNDKSEYYTPWVRCLKIHDGKLYSTGSDDTTIKIWDCNNDSFEHLGTLTEHLEGIASLAIYNDQLISGSSDRICIWSCKDHSLIATLDTGGDYLSVHNDILYVSSYVDICMWDLSTHQRIDIAKLETAKMATEYVGGLATYKGKLFSAHAGGIIKVFECEGLSLSAIHGDPKADTLSVDDLRARVLARCVENEDGDNVYSEVIKESTSKDPNSPLVRLYNTHVCGTRDLDDAQRAAPFWHNITFASGK
jgi:WD40 repeat protein